MVFLDGRVEYFIKRKGYPDNRNSCVAEENINSKDLITEHEKLKETERPVSLKRCLDPTISLSKRIKVGHDAQPTRSIFLPHGGKKLQPSGSSHQMWKFRPPEKCPKFEPQPRIMVPSSSTSPAGIKPEFHQRTSTVKANTVLPRLTQPEPGTKSIQTGSGEKMIIPESVYGANASNSSMVGSINFREKIKDRNFNHLKKDRPQKSVFLSDDVPQMPRERGDAQGVKRRPGRPRKEDQLNRLTYGGYFGGTLRELMEKKSSIMSRIKEEREIKKNCIFVAAMGGEIVEVRGKDRQKAVMKATSKFEAIKRSVGRIMEIEKTKYRKQDEVGPKELKHVCPYCEYCTTKNLRTHIKQRHQDQCGHSQDPPGVNLQCPVCSVNVKGKETMKKHIMLLHAVQTGPKTWSCAKCFYPYGDQHELMNHIFTCPKLQINSEAKESDSVASNPTNIFNKCNHCALTFSSEEEIKKHMAAGIHDPQHSTEQPVFTVNHENQEVLLSIPDNLITEAIDSLLINFQNQCSQPDPTDEFLVQIETNQIIKTMNKGDTIQGEGGGQLNSVLELGHLEGEDSQENKQIVRMVTEDQGGEAQQAPLQLPGDQTCTSDSLLKIPTTDGYKNKLIIITDGQILMTMPKDRLSMLSMSPFVNVADGNIILDLDSSSNFYHRKICS